jgi:hypothetical protein
MTKTKLTIEERLRMYYKSRKWLYGRGNNNEKLNDKIRKLQKETNFKIKEV